MLIAELRKEDATVAIKRPWDILKLIVMLIFCAVVGGFIGYGIGGVLGAVIGAIIGAILGFLMWLSDRLGRRTTT